MVAYFCHGCILGPTTIRLQLNPQFKSILEHLHSPRNYPSFRPLRPIMLREDNVAKASESLCH